MSSAIPGSFFTTAIYNGPANLVGTMGVQIQDGVGGVVTPRTTGGFYEAPANSGVYIITMLAPSEEGQYILVIDNGSSFYASEELLVSASADDDVFDEVYYEATFDQATSGLVGTIGVTVYDSSGNAVTTRTTSDIVESPVGSGIYTASVGLPEDGGYYVIVADTGGSTPTYAAEVVWVLEGRVERIYSDLMPGPHSVLERNGIIFNNREQYERYFVTEFTGFIAPDLRLSAQDNSQEDFALPDPAFYSGRTMTMSGFIEASSYSRFLQMARDLANSMINLNELPLKITKQPGSFLVHDDVTISCRPSAQPMVDTKLQEGDLGRAKIKRPFSVSFRAETDGVYRGTIRRHGSLVPSFASTYGRTYDKVYDYTYDVAIGPESTNFVELTNYGNYDARPVIRFNGGMNGVVLTNNANGHKIILDFPVANGDYIEIDVLAGTILDQNGNNRAQYMNMTSDWMRIQGRRDSFTGVNQFTVTTTYFDSDASIDIWFYDEVV